MELTVQHADFSFDELGEVSADEIRRRLVDHDWEAGRAAYIRHMADHGRGCPPSLYATQSDDYCLHVYAATVGFEVAVLIPRPKKFLGILKIAPTSSVVRAAETLDELMPVVDAFFENDPQGMIDYLDRTVM